LLAYRLFNYSAAPFRRRDGVIAPLNIVITRRAHPASTRASRVRVTQFPFGRRAAQENWVTRIARPTREGQIAPPRMARARVMTVGVMAAPFRHRARENNPGDA